MKKTLAVILAGVITLSMCACSAKTEKQDESEASKEQTEIANPWTDCTSLSEAEDIAGFSYNFQEVVYVGAYHAAQYRAMKGKMLEIIYDAEGTGLTIRQSAGEGEDISGDYTEYSHDFTVEESGISAEMKGTKDVIHQTIFSYEGYSYSIFSEEGETYEEVACILSELTGVEPLEGAPVVEEGRYIDSTAVNRLDVAGRYSGINYGECSVSMFTSEEEDSAEVGTIEITNEDGSIAYSGTLIEVMDNYYEIQGEDINITVFTDNGTVNLDLYINGEHADYFTMVETFAS